MLESSRRVKGPRGRSQWECNLAADWSEMATGGGHSRSRGTLRVPVTSKASFISTENAIGEYLKQSLLDSMLEAGNEEKQLAE